MQHLSVQEFADKWGLSVRTVRNYCVSGKIAGAVREGRAWRIPETAEPPEFGTRKNNRSNALLRILRDEKSSHRKGGIYHKIQIEMTYNSNHIEGSRLTHDQTRYIYETNTIGLSDSIVNVDDIIETVNHFRCIDLAIDSANQKLTEALIKQFHETLKRGTADSRKEWFAVGSYKRFPNEVGGHETIAPEDVAEKMRMLLGFYNAKSQHSFEDLLDFHVSFESIHPFQDGNGRVGRLILLKECLKNRIVPFMIDDSLKLYYYRGLQNWQTERGYLTDTCLTAQDRFKKLLDYFQIPY